MRFVLSLILILSLSSSAFAQKKRDKKSSAPRFIENIELDREATLIDYPEVKNTVPATTAIVRKGDSSPIEHCSKVQFKYAMMMDREVESIRDLNLYCFIDDWFNTPYRYGGNGKDGIDCSAFVKTLSQSVYGASLPRTAREQFGETERLERDELSEGDLVFFNTRGGVSHVGIYLGNDFFVHSSTNKGVVISSLEEDYYRKRFLGGGRNPQKRMALSSALN